jgi:hypothetical protein
MSESILVSNETDDASNATHIIIKQVFLTIDPREFVRWDDLFMMMMYWLLIYLAVACSIKQIRDAKRREQEAVAANTEACVINEDGNVRVIHVQAVQ